MDALRKRSADLRYSMLHKFHRIQVTLRRKLRILPGSDMGPREAAIFEELYRCYADDVFRFSLYLSGN